MNFKARPAALVLAALVGVGSFLWAAETRDTASQTPAQSKTPRKKKTPLKDLKAVGEKVLTPNPTFQGPTQRSMPTNSPTTPKLIHPDQEPPAPTAAERFMRGAASLMTTTWDDNIFVWLPAISTDPNTGPTYGLMPVLVLADKVTKHIRHLVAPSYTYNEFFGQTATGRYYFYPTDQSQFYGVASISQRTNRELKTRYEDTALLGGRIFVRGEAFYRVDGSQRFFGIGPDTRETDETGYVGRDKVLHADVGVNFLRSWRASFGIRYRDTEIGENIIPGKTDLKTSFPAVQGVEEQDTIVQKFHLLWDSRDYAVTPSSGSTGELYFEKTSRGWGSDSDFHRFGIEGKKFFPWRGGKQTTVLHGLYDRMYGPVIPFYELADLGGRETLRGYGDGRFTDKGRIVFNAEQRFELVSIPLMGVVTRFEVGPFIDVGTVFPRAQELQMKDMRPVFGGAFRAVVKPNVVGSVDVGVGKEGVGVYVGINYPF